MFTSQHAHAGGVALSTVLLGLFAIAAIATLVWTSVCPCERTPGGYLLGSSVDEPVADWSFANDVGLCQIQVQRGLLPHSINLNCMADSGELFLSCARCDGKAWSTAAINNPEARLRIDGRVYPVRLTRVEDAATLDRAWRARESKLGRPADRPRQEGWWSFRVDSRSS
jgi:hypothetical protein